MDDAYRVIFEQRLKTVLKSEDVLARVGGGSSRFGDGLISAPILPREAAALAYLQEVLGPGKLALFESSRVADGILFVQWSEMIGGQRRGPADHVTNRGDVFAHVSQAFVGCYATVVHSVRAVFNQLCVQIHLEEGNTHVFALPHALRIDLRILVIGGIGIDPNAVALLLADKPVGWYFINLPRN